MNCKKDELRTFKKSLVIRFPIKAKDITLRVKADCRNPHWHDSVDKWSEEWACIIHKKGISYGVYGPIDQDSGQSVADGAYVVEFVNRSGVEIEKSRIKDIEIIRIDSHYLKR